MSERYPRKDSFRLNPFLLPLKFIGGSSLFFRSFFFDFFFFSLCVLQLKRKSHFPISLISATEVENKMKGGEKKKSLKLVICDKQMRQDAILRCFMFKTGLKTVDTMGQNIK